MKIDGNSPIERKDLYSGVHEVDKQQETKNKKDVEKADAEKDKISLSGRANKISALKAEIDQIPDVRTDKIDAVKHAIDTGNYNIDARKIAQKILEEL